MMQTTKVALEGLLKSLEIKELTDAMIRNVIQEAVIPSFKYFQSITKEKIIEELKESDQSRDSWMKEDLSGKDIKIPESNPIYINIGVQEPLHNCPKVPDGLKLISLKDPNGLELSDVYPVILTKKAQYWPFGYKNNSLKMVIIAYDYNGNQLRSWEKEGARYIWKIEEDPNTGDILFVGQAGNKITIKWSELMEVYPENLKPKARLIELVADIEDDLNNLNASSLYDSLKKDILEDNEGITQVYNTAGLPLNMIKIDILDSVDITSDIRNEYTTLEIAKICKDIASFDRSIKYLCPVILKLLIQKRLITEKKAAQAFYQFLLPFFDEGTTTTCNLVGYNILSEIINSKSVSEIKIYVDDIQGEDAKDQLRESIHKLYVTRTIIRSIFLRMSIIDRSTSKVSSTLQAANYNSGPLNEQMIRNLIQKDVDPTITREESRFLDRINAELVALDTSRNSWCKEDPIHPLPQ
jgi:hypothetical protein